MNQPVNLNEDESNAALQAHNLMNAIKDQAYSAPTSSTAASLTTAAMLQHLWSSMANNSQQQTTPNNSIQKRS